MSNSLNDGDRPKYQSDAYNATQKKIELVALGDTNDTEAGLPTHRRNKHETSTKTNTEMQEDSRAPVKSHDEPEDADVTLVRPSQIHAPRPRPSTVVRHNFITSADRKRKRSL